MINWIMSKGGSGVSLGFGGVGGGTAPSQYLQNYIRFMPMRFSQVDIWYG